MNQPARASIQATTPIPTITRSHGFTLIEALVSITLMGIVAGFALPGLNGILQRQRTSNFAHEVAAQINETKNRALANDQWTYSGNSNGCSSTQSYITSWITTIDNTSPATSTINANVAPMNSCATTTVAPRSQLSLPGDMTFNIASGTKTQLKFDTTSGIMQYQSSGGSFTTISGKQAFVTVTNNSNSTIVYTVCVSPAGIAYVNSGTSCP